MSRTFIATLLSIVSFVALPSAQDGTVPSHRDPLLGEDLPVFAHINLGFQSQRQDFRQGARFPLYDETASWDTFHELEGGATLDIGGAVGLRKLSPWLRDVSAGLTYTARSTHRRDVVVDVQVPHPIFTDTLRAVAATVPDFQHSERAVHVQALYRLPVTPDISAVFFGGPSIFWVRDEFIEVLTVAEAGGDLSSVNVEAVRAGQREVAGGFNVGVEGRYIFLRDRSFMREVGVGALVRYSRGSVRLALPGNADGPQKIHSGGPEFATALRFAF